VTNSNEGALFINSATADTVQVPTYVANLFPKLSMKDATKAADVYGAPLGSPIERVTTIMAEGGGRSILQCAITNGHPAIFVCPSYFLLKGFNKGPTFKVCLQTLLRQTSALICHFLQGSIRDSPWWSWQ
jgi:hypothetical protein